MIANQNLNWANVWWILGADYLSFEGFIGDFRKNILQTDFEREKTCKEIPGKDNILHWKRYYSWRIMLKKISYTVIWGKRNSNSRGLGKKWLPQNHPYPPPPQTSYGHVDHLAGWGKKRIWHLSKCHPSKKCRAGARIKWWFSRLKFCISRLKIRR